MNLWSFTSLFHILDSTAHLLDLYHVCILTLSISSASTIAYSHHVNSSLHILHSFIIFLQNWRHIEHHLYIFSGFIVLNPHILHSVSALKYRLHFSVSTRNGVDIIVSFQKMSPTFLLLGIETLYNYLKSCQYYFFSKSISSDSWKLWSLSMSFLGRLSHNTERCFRMDIPSFIPI